MDIKKVTIEQLKEGFLVTDQDDERYAVISLFSWLEQRFDLPKEESKPESKKKKLMSGKIISSELTDPDRIYKPFGLSRTRIDKDQEYTKIGEI